jgi:hypothetical protein
MNSAVPNSLNNNNFAEFCDSLAEFGGNLIEGGEIEFVC